MRLGGAAASAARPPSDAADLEGARAAALSLLRDWGDGMLRLQVRSRLGRNRGGLLCPACGRVHGRSFEAAYPLLKLAGETGDDAYVDAARGVFDWSRRVSCGDGSWANDRGHGWRATTVFGVAAIGQSLRFHGDLLPPAERRRWEDRLAQAAEWVFREVDLTTGGINYPLAAAWALQLTGSLLDRPRYLSRAAALADGALAYIQPDSGLLAGEGEPRDGTTRRGCKAIDVAYNVGESLPAGALYALDSGSTATLQSVVASLRAHLQFELPDGGWDESWCTRSYKWSYWGTRTGGGPAAGYALLTAHDARFAGAAMRNLELLARCTHHGLLQGGLHYDEADVPPCAHHTFVQAKTVATILDFQPPPATRWPRLAAAPPDGSVVDVPGAATCLVRCGPWRGTITANDCVYPGAARPSGGVLSLLWHDAVGPLIATSASGAATPEPHNAQPHRGMFRPTTLRVETDGERVPFRSTEDPDAYVEWEDAADGAEFRVAARLVDRAGEASGETCRLGYRFAPRSLDLTVVASAAGRLVLPIVASSQEPAERLASHRVRIRRSTGVVEVAALTGEAVAGDLGARIFSASPGFQAVELSIALSPDAISRVRVVAT